MRRVLAWALDCCPLVGLAAWAAPSVLALVTLRAEAAQGIGLFDPTVGGDPVLLRHLPDGRVMLAGALVWVAVELVARARRGRSLGEAVTHVPAPRSAGRAWLVDACRYGVLLAWIGAAAVAPRLARAEPQRFFGAPAAAPTAAP